MTQTNSVLPGSVTIIGAGQAGGWVAATLREEGYAGPITLIGDEPHPPYERPPLSKQALLGELPVERTYLKPTEYYHSAGIALRTGVCVTAIDRATRTLTFDDGETAAYDLLVLASGSRARKLDLPGAASLRVHYLRNLADMLKLQTSLRAGRSVTIIGGGFIGLEIAASAVQLGLTVTVLEQASVLIGRVLPSVVSDYLTRRHRAAGVRIITDARVLGFEEQPDSILVRLDGLDPVTADSVVIGVGAIPNTEIAAAAGIAVADGILVDAFGRTSDPHVWAAGDATRHFNPLLDRHVRLESWQNAQNQAIAVARSIVGRNAMHAEVPWLWSDQYDINLQMAGIARGGEQIVVRGNPADDRFTVFLLDAGIMTAACTVNQPRDMRFARQAIAAGTVLDPSALADPAVALPALLKKAA